MKSKLINLMIVMPFLALGGWVVFQLLAGWLGGGTPILLSRSVPGMDGGPSESERIKPDALVVELTGKLEQFDGKPSVLSGEWPNFRGADLDNISKSNAQLADQWPKNGPEVLWSVELGEGHAAPAVLNGCVYLFDYDEQARADALRCFSLDDGKEIWRRSYALPAKRNHGLSRTIPAVSEDYVVTIGPRCHVSCVDRSTGAFRWGIDLQQKYGTTEPLWFTGQCPLLDGDRVILAPAGSDILMMAVDCNTGDLIWKVPNPKKWKMSHSSIMPMKLFGERVFVYAAIGGMVGVSEEGRLLWDIPWNASVIAPSPVLLNGNRIFITAGYGAGSLLVEIGKTTDGFSASVLSKTGPKEWLASEQQTPIYHDGLLYGIMPKDAGSLKQQFVCYEPESGELVWSSGKTNRFGLGPFILADQKFYILDDDGTLTVLELSKTGYTPLAQHRVLDGHDAWGPIALAGSRMLLRDSTRMICIEAGKAK